jgi:sporulation protein YlmC with PRC-barrel domain
MKKLSFLLSAIVILTMALAACSGAEQATETPFATEDGFVDETQMAPTLEATEPVVETPLATEPAETEPVLTPTEVMETSEPITDTGDLPSTGAVDPGLASNLMDFDVWNTNDEQIGTVDDLILDLDEETVEYVVISVGGFLGLGDKEIAVPWEALELATESALVDTGTVTDTMDSHPNAFVLDVSEETINQAPDLDVDSLPDIGQDAPGWDDEFRNFWANLEAGITPDATEIPEPSTTITDTAEVTGTMELQGVALASDYVNSSVISSDGEDLGIIVNAVIDVETGELKYALLSSTASTSLNDGVLTAVPLRVLSWDADNQVFVLNVDAATLDQAPHFDVDLFPDTQEDGWDIDISDYWDLY